MKKWKLKRVGQLSQGIHQRDKSEEELINMSKSQM